MAELCKISFNLGMINAFCEMLGQGVKRLALSPPIENCCMAELMPQAIKIAESFGANCHADEAFLPTLLASKQALQGKTVILLYKDPQALSEYLEIKHANYDIETATQHLRSLLGYPLK